MTEFDEDELRRWFERAFGRSSERIRELLERLRALDRERPPDPDPEAERRRAREGLPMWRIRDALHMSGGDIDAAFNALRKEGLRQPAKFPPPEVGRVAVWTAPDASAGVLVALGCQTDFLPAQDEFQALLAETLRLAAEQAPADSEALLALAHPATGTTLGEQLGRLESSSGEKIWLAKFQRFENKAGVVGSYVHHDAKKGALVSVTCSADAATAAAFFKQLCRHIVSAMPLPSFTVQVLAEQAWMLDDKLTVQKAVEAALGKGAKIEGFARFQIGK